MTGPRVEPIAMRLLGKDLSAGLNQSSSRAEDRDMAVAGPSAPPEDDSGDQQDSGATAEEHRELQDCPAESHGEEDPLDG